MYDERDGCLVGIVIAIIACLVLMAVAHKAGTDQCVAILAYVRV